MTWLLACFSLKIKVSDRDSGSSRALFGRWRRARGLSPSRCCRMKCGSYWDKISRVPKFTSGGNFMFQVATSNHKSRAAPGTSSSHGRGGAGRVVVLYYIRSSSSSLLPSRYIYYYTSTSSTICDKPTIAHAHAMLSRSSVCWP